MSAKRSISVIVPTYCEAENLPHLVEKIEEVKDQHDLMLELLIMDDDSPDGTPDIIKKLGRDWVTLHVRTEDRGLSQAVIDGLERARHDFLIVMDGDLSHPSSAILPMVEALEGGAEFVLGSRYVAGGTTSDDWGLSSLAEQPGRHVDGPAVHHGQRPHERFLRHSSGHLCESR